MSDIVLLYLFTRLDAISTAGAVGAAALLFVGGMAMAIAYADGTLDGCLGYRKPWIASIVVCLLLVLLTPSKQDMAIIVGGKIALDAGRSDTAKELGQEVLDAIRAQLKKAKK